MNEVKKETMEILNMMPTVNSASAYGSGYFKQEDKNGEKKSMDLILSVDNPNNWHQENYSLNPDMYKGTGKKHLFNNGLNGEAKFPKSLSCFFTDYKDREYKIVVVDKRLLYNDLKTWDHFSLPGRFQKEMKLLIDNSNGELFNLMHNNYENAVKTGLLLTPKEIISPFELYENIVSLSYLGDMRNIFHFEDPNKIKNVVEGSYDFFEKVYGQSNLYYRLSSKIIKPESYQSKLIKPINTLPKNLKDYILNQLSLDELTPENVSEVIRKYFMKKDFTDSLTMALRCNQTVGPQKVAQTLIGKFKKGRQKVKK